MNPLHHGFTEELLKLAETESDRKELQKIYRQVKRQQGKQSRLSGLRGEGRQVSRDYLASTALGALGAPASMLAGAALRKRLGNRALRKAMETASAKEKRRLKRQIDTKPLVGTIRGPKGTVNKEDLAGSAAQGAVFGSVLQMLRDRFSGSKGVKQPT